MEPNTNKKPNSEYEELNSIKSNDLFKNLKNDYFLLKLFDYLQSKKKLEIIKYNKYLQQRMNLNIKNELVNTFSYLDVSSKC